MSKVSVPWLDAFATFDEPFQMDEPTYRLWQASSCTGRHPLETCGHDRAGGSVPGMGREHHTPDEQRAFNPKSPRPSRDATDTLDDADVLPRTIR